MLWLVRLQLQSGSLAAEDTTTLATVPTLTHPRLHKTTRHTAAVKIALYSIGVVPRRFSSEAKRTFWGVLRSLGTGTPAFTPARTQMDAPEMLSVT